MSRKDPSGLILCAVAGSFESRMKFIDALPTEVGSYRLPEGKETKVILTVDAAYPYVSRELIRIASGTGFRCASHDTAD